MTKRLEQLNSTDALYATARLYPGGIEALAARMGMSASVLYKKLERSGSHHLRDDEFDEVLALCEAARVPDAYRALHAKAWRHGHVAIRLPDVDAVSGADLADSVMRFFKEGGEVASQVREALSDGAISERECAAIDAEVEQTMAALAELRERVKARCRSVPAAAKLRSV